MRKVQIILLIALASISKSLTFKKIMYKLQIDYNPGKKNVDKFYVQDLPQCHY